MTGLAKGEERVTIVDTWEEGKVGRVKRACATTPPMEWAIIRTEGGGEGEEE